MLLVSELTAQSFLRFYVRYFSEFWENMTPGQYGGLLIFIAVCGYLLMRSSR